MCKFFSFNSDGMGKTFYFDWELRKKVLSGELKDYNPDSHSSIAHYFGYRGKGEDLLNRYEYDFFAKKLIADRINVQDDAPMVEMWVKGLDSTKIVEPLILKPVIYPFKIKPDKVTESDKKMLKKWALVRASVWDSVWASVGDSVWASVRDSVWASVRDSVGASVRNSVWASVRDSVGASVGDSVWASVGDSVWASVRDSVWASVGDSVWAYLSSFFQISYGFDFTSAIRLWERGFVPSFDGKTWRLHSGPKAKIVFEQEIK